MIDIVKNIFDLMIYFINYIFTFEIDLNDNVKVSLGILICSFVLFVLVLYYILKAIGIIDKGDD